MCICVNLYMRMYVCMFFPLAGGPPKGSQRVSWETPRELAGWPRPFFQLGPTKLPFQSISIMQVTAFAVAVSGTINDIVFFWRLRLDREDAMVFFWGGVLCRSCGSGFHVVLMASKHCENMRFEIIDLKMCLHAFKGADSSKIAFHSLALLGSSWQRQ